MTGKLAASSAFVLAFSLYILFGIPDVVPQTEAPTPALLKKPEPTSTPNPVAVLTSTTTPVVPTRTPPPIPPPAPQPTGQYRDGTYAGPVTDAYYGNVQVQAVIRNGKLANVVFLQYPSDRGTSRAINGQAMPYLIQEAIAAQSGNVDIVSGATDTSMAFQQSLSAALAVAKR